MDFAQKLRNPFIQQYAIEILFPILGYFFFDWDILIIGVYYLIDHLCAQIMFFRRAHWINIKGRSPVGPQLLVLSILVFVGCFLAEVMALNFAVINTQKMSQEVVINGFFDFAKSELWLLFPVVLFVYHLKDQFTFYAKRQYLKLKYKPYVLMDMLRAVIILALLFAGVFLWYKLLIPNAVILFIFIGVKITFDLSVRKVLKVRSEA